MQTNTLRGKKQLLIGFTLFSMFFGAGNLIFPPYLGAQAGTRLWLAFAGFAVSAIGLPIAGVVAVARAGGLPQLAERVHPRFAQVFSILVYLSIGPCLAIPRTASTSFAMLEPLAGESTALQWGYSLLFFAVAFLVAQHPEKLTQRLGKILCPALLALILLLFAGCLLHPAAAGYGTPTAAYTALPAVQGILDEQGRERGYHLIWIEHDLMDPRTVSRKTMRDKVNEYMRTVMRAEPIDPSLCDFDDENCM